MKVKVEGVLIDVVCNEWEFDNKKGVTYRALVYSDAKVQPVKIKIEELEKYRKLINQQVSFDCSIYVNGKYNLTVL